MKDKRFRKASSVMEPVLDARFDIGGEVGKRLAAVTDNWLLSAVESNPAMLEMFRDVDRLPSRNPLPWSGEFAGKFLTHAVEIHRLRPDARLWAHLEWFVSRLLGAQEPDGYLGPMAKADRLVKGWDLWGHYHVMIGLLAWHDASADAAALRGACAMADYMCNRFLDQPQGLLSAAGACEMNHAPVHALALLYARTGCERYLRLAEKIVREFELPQAGDYLRHALAGEEFCSCPKPRWESLHPIMGLAELHYITGEQKYAQAFQKLWWSMLKTDRHNNGAFSSGEQAVGDPYARGSTETCCTVAWMALSVEMLRMTGLSIVADELELSMLNVGLGLISSSGKWVTFDTPMDGRRIHSTHSINFQARAGADELNCCSVNGPRVLGLLAEWAVMRRADGVALNYYGPGTLEAPLPDGNTVTLRQTTEYPCQGRVEIEVGLDRPERCTLAFRIPYWSRRTRVRVDGSEVPGVEAGRYLELTRQWRGGERIGIDLDMAPHVWVHPGPYQPPMYDWETTWTIFGPPEDPADVAVMESVTTVEQVRAVAGSAVAHGYGDKSELRFALLFAGRPERGSWCYTEVDSDIEGVLPLRVRVEGEWACFVNGRQVGGRSEAESAGPGNFCPVYLPVKQGRNLVCFRVRTSGGGWVLALHHGRVLTHQEWNAPQPQRASLYRGPILLAHDGRMGEGPWQDPPTLAAGNVDLAPASSDLWPAPWMEFQTPDEHGCAVRLCDFASAGAAGNFYFSWLPMRFPKEAATASFTPENPLRSIPLA